MIFVYRTTKNYIEPKNVNSSFEKKKSDNTKNTVKSCNYQCHSIFLLLVPFIFNLKHFSLSCVTLHTNQTMDLLSRFNLKTSFMDKNKKNRRIFCEININEIHRNRIYIYCKLITMLKLRLT